MQPINKYLAIFGLFLVSLTAWGSNIYGSQAYMLAVFGLIVLSVMAGGIIIPVFGLYISSWYVYIQIAGSIGYIPRETILQAVDSMTLIMSGLAIYIFVKSGRIPVKTWMNSICVLAAVLSVIGIIQYYYVGQVAATLGCSNFLAAFIAISSIFCFRRKWCLVLIPIIICLFLTKTSTAIAAMFIGSGFYLWRWKGVLISVSPAILYWIIFKTPQTLLMRFDYWKDAIFKISNSLETFIFGVGPGIFWKTDNMLHSEYLYALWNFGIIGVGLLLIYIFSRDTSNRLLFPAFLVILVDGVGNHLMHTAPTAMLSVIVLGLNDSQNKESPDDRFRYG